MNVKCDFKIDPVFLERVLVYLERHNDQDDYRGDSWKSDQLKRDINELIDLLGLPEERKQVIY
jgi:hypothetical protein